MQLNDHQNTIFLDRYSKRDQENQPIETNVDEMFDRVANAIGNNDTERKAFRGILDGFHFVPGGRIIAASGTEKDKTYYNCFVIPVETRARRTRRANYANIVPEWIDPDQGSDSRRAIFDTMETMVDIMSRGGGVGINWSTLRPAKSYLKRVSGVSSGPVGWMNVASQAVGEVEQGGSRRGAAMFMMWDWHPDVEKFIEAKTVAGKIENANISVAVSDKFMEAVESDEDWEFKFPDTTHEAYDTEWDGDIREWIGRGYPVKSYGKVRARDLWAKLAYSAWRSGEPGVVFMDRYNDLSTAGEIEKIISVNPCGEQGLGAYSVCNLGSMNLDAYVGKVSETEWGFDWAQFIADVKVAVRFLDNVIDKTNYLHEDTKRQQVKLRRIGLGVMGLADALIKLNMRYGSNRAAEFTENIFRTMKDAAITASMQLAEERGPAGGWNGRMWSRPYLAEFLERRPIKSPGALRNLFLLTQAPTGTTSSLAGVNSGIEPYFEFEYTRKDRTGEHKIRTKILDWADANSVNPDVLVTSSNLTGKEHLVMQAAVQKYLDSSVSKTVNFVNSATVEDVQEVYDLAYDLGCKGLAVYRDGSRAVQVLNRDEPKVEAGLNGTASAPSFDKQAMPMIAFATQQSDTCPVCSGTVVRQEGCSKCQSCSWSAC